MSRSAILLLVLVPLLSCGVEEPAGIEREVLTCSIPLSEIVDGGPGIDGIPALQDPPLVGAGSALLDYLAEDDRVVGLLVGSVAIAVPHNILWWHEIVNLNVGSVSLAVTFGPLTGSSLAFDRATVDDVTFGVSGLLYRNNLVMYDRNQRQSLWPQMSLGARCGSLSGVALPVIPVIEMTWAAWRALHPGTRVLSGDLNLGRNYREYPYGMYDRIDNEELIFPLLDVDTRRPLKERVLGVPTAGGSVAFPFGEMERAGGLAVLDVGDATGTIVLWDGAARGAMAYRPTAGGQTLTLEVRDGRFVDRETGSDWGVDGIARAGPLAGERLVPLAEAHTSFWFAWAAFHPGTLVWTVD